MLRTRLGEPWSTKSIRFRPPKISPMTPRNMGVLPSEDMCLCVTVKTSFFHTYKCVTPYLFLIFLGVHQPQPSLKEFEIQKSPKTWILLQVPRTKRIPRRRWVRYDSTSDECEKHRFFRFTGPGSRKGDDNTRVQSRFHSKPGSQGFFRNSCLVNESDLFLSRNKR